MSPRKERNSTRSASRRRADSSHDQLVRAQQLVYEAFDQEDPERQIALARQAVEMSPDCADAFILLGDNVSGTEEALPLYEQAVEAGERAIGASGFRDYAGHFWGILETRPYMRARWELAECLLALGQVDGAIEHFRAMLELNPNDN